tara:strand:+ start:682 stop:891 length:210 start_codon:yes stop_codon:yes gene_type:complete
MDEPVFTSEVAKSLAMAEAISNLAHAHQGLNDEDMKAIVKIATDVCLSHMLPRQRQSADLVGMDGGKMQ